MRLRRPLDSILGTPALVRVLRSLTSPWLVGLELTGREVARQARINHVAAARALKKLSEVGLVSAQQRGRAYVYRFHYDNVIVEKGLLPLFRLERDLFDEAVEYIKRRFERRVISAVLFGSYARHEEDNHSDFDILFLVRSKSEADSLETDLSNSAADFYRRFGVALTPYVKDIGTFREMVAKKVPVTEEIRSQGSHLFGRSIGEVLKRAASSAS